MSRLFRVALMVKEGQLYDVLAQLEGQVFNVEVQIAGMVGDDEKPVKRKGAGRRVPSGALTPIVMDCIAHNGGSATGEQLRQATIAAGIPLKSLGPAIATLTRYKRIEKTAPHVYRAVQQLNRTEATP